MPTPDEIFSKYASRESSPASTAQTADAILGKYLPKMEAAPMKQEPISGARAMMYGAGELGLGAATAARDLATKIPGIGPKIESATKPYYDQAIEGSKAAHQQAVQSGKTLQEGIGYYGPQAVIPGAGETRLGTAALGGVANIASNILDPTQSKQQRYGVGENLAAGATGAVATPFITGALGNTLTKGMEALKSKSLGQAAKGALKTAVAPVTGAFSEAAKTAGDLFMKTPGGSSLVSAAHRIFDPKAAAASTLQSKAVNLKDSILRLENNAKAATKAGTLISTGQGARDPGLASFERELRSNKGSEPALFPERQHQIAGEVLRSITEGHPESLEQLGKSLGERKKMLIKEAGDATKGAWEKLETVLPGDTPHAPNSVAKLFSSAPKMGNIFSAGTSPEAQQALLKKLHVDSGLTEESKQLRKLLAPSDLGKLEKMVKTDIQGPMTVSDMKALKGKYYDLAEKEKREVGKDTKLGAAYRVISQQFNKEEERAYGDVSPNLLKQAREASAHEMKYRNILHDYLGGEHRDINDASKAAGRFMDSLRNAKGMDTQAFNLMWNKAPQDMKADVFNYTFSRALNPQNLELDRNHLIKIIKTMSPEVKRKFEEFRPGQMKRIQTIAEQLDLERFLQRAQVEPGSNTVEKLNAALGKNGNPVLKRVASGLTWGGTEMGQYGWALLTGEKTRSAILERAIIDPDYARALLTYDTSKAGQQALQNGNLSVLREALQNIGK